MTKLSINVNKIALLRNSRDIEIPSVTEAARICVRAGADGITVHPRPDQRHIRPGDVWDLAKMLTVEFNIEGNPFAGKEGNYPGFMEIVRRVRPTQATLVPDARNQKTSDHGWNLKKDARRVEPLIRKLRGWGVRVSLFMDPDVPQIELAPKIGADRVELYTEPYASAHKRGGYKKVLKQFADAAEAAQELGLGVNAGHDLSLENLSDFVRAVPNVLEVSIGHALISDALKMGLAATVRAYRKALAEQ